MVVHTFQHLVLGVCFVEAFVTLATNDSYAIGSLVLANSLKAAGTTKELAIMITKDVSQELRSFFRPHLTLLALVHMRIFVVKNMHMQATIKEENKNHG